MAFDIKSLNATVSVSDTQHNNSAIILSVIFFTIMLIVLMWIVVMLNVMVPSFRLYHCLKTNLHFST
jgi:hypothetical protein